VCGAFGRLAGAAERVGAGDVEVTQDRVAQAVGAAGSRSMISAISFEEP